MSKLLPLALSLAVLATPAFAQEQKKVDPPGAGGQVGKTTDVPAVNAETVQAINAAIKAVRGDDSLEKKKKNRVVRILNNAKRQLTGKPATKRKRPKKVDGDGQSDGKGKGRAGRRKKAGGGAGNKRRKNKKKGDGDATGVGK